MDEPDDAVAKLKVVVGRTVQCSVWFTRGPAEAERVLFWRTRLGSNQSNRMRHRRKLAREDGQQRGSRADLTQERPRKRDKEGQRGTERGKGKGREGEKVGVGAMNPDTRRSGWSYVGDTGRDQAPGGSARRPAGERAENTSVRRYCGNRLVTNGASL